MSCPNVLGKDMVSLLGLSREESEASAQRLKEEMTGKLPDDLYLIEELSRGDDCKRRYLYYLYGLYSKQGSCNIHFHPEHSEVYRFLGLSRDEWEEFYPELEALLNSVVTFAEAIEAIYRQYSNNCAKLVMALITLGCLVCLNNPEVAWVVRVY